MSVKTAESKDRMIALFGEARGAARGPEWLAPERELALARFAEAGFPTTRSEAWKYTDVSAAVAREYRLDVAADVPDAEISRHLLPEADGARIVYVNGRLYPALTSVTGLGGGVALLDLAHPSADRDAVRQYLGALLPDEGEPFGALNTAFAAGGPLLLVPAGSVVDRPVQFLYVSGGRAPALACPRALVVAGPASQVRVVESFVSVGASAPLTVAAAEFALEPGALVEHYRVQNEDATSTHVGSTDVRVARDATYNAVSLHFGAALSRHDLRVRLVEPGASCRIDGLYAVGGGQHADSHTAIDHAVPDCVSSQVYKGVLDGDARAVFNGRVVVRPDAQRTNANQTNKNLLLSPEARVDTKPELEIFADDVKCSHGATVGALDEEEQFYLASRGIDAETARGLLTFGFAEEIVAEVRTESLRAALDALILARFRKGATTW